MVISQHTGPQERSYFPIALQFLQAPLFTKQAADLYPCSKKNNRSQECINVLCTNHFHDLKSIWNLMKSIHCLSYCSLSISKEIRWKIYLPVNIICFPNTLSSRRFLFPLPLFLKASQERKFKTSLSGQGHSQITYVLAWTSSVKVNWGLRLHNIAVKT